MNRAAWFDRLHDVAPDAGDALLHTLAAVLAAPTESEALLIVADALREAAEAVAEDSRAPLARLANRFRVEAALRPFGRR